MDQNENPGQFARKTGLWLSLLSFPVGAFFASTGVTWTWNLFREFYCRAYHDSAVVLCHYIFWEFRPDALLILVGSFVVYAIIHFWRLPELSRRAHAVVILVLGVVWLLVVIASKTIRWEAWY